MPAPPITSAGRFSPLGPRGIIFLLFICGAVLGFRGKFVEIGLISICLVLWRRDWNGSAGSVIALHPSTFAPKQSHGHKFFSLLCAKHAGGALRWWVQIALKPASKTRRLHRVFIRGKGLEYVIADSAFKRMQIDARVFRLDAGEHHRGLAPRTSWALNCNEWNDGRRALSLGHDASLE